MYTVLEAGEAVCKQAHKYSTLQLVVVAHRLFALVPHPEQEQYSASVESSSSFAAGTTTLVSKIRCSSAHSAV
jgi:hypothetical protein